MTQPNEQLIETIEDALEFTSSYIVYHFGKEKVKEWLRFLLEDNKRLMIALHTHESYDKTVAELYEELEHVKAERDEAGEIVKAAVIPCNVCMENGCDCDVTYISDFATGEMVAKQYNEIQSLHTELAAKDKVLGWYADEETYELKINDESDPPGQAYTDVIEDRGERARTIISSYPPREKGANNKNTPAQGTEEEK